MKISVNVVADRTVRLSVAGEIEMATVGDVERGLADALTTPGITKVIVDFADVTFCDSSGIAALDRAYAMATRREICLRLENVRRNVRRVLELTGLLDALTDPGQA